MIDSQWPESWISSFRPVDGGIKHHCSSNPHTRLNCSLCFAILMMAACTRMPYGLSELGRMCHETSGSEAGAIVGGERLGNHSNISCLLFKSFRGSKSLMSVQMLLKLHNDIARWFINKQAVATVQCNPLPLKFCQNVYSRRYACGSWTRHDQCARARHSSVLAAFASQKLVVFCSPSIRLVSWDSAC
jgi:hypothetical protein